MLKSIFDVFKKISDTYPNSRIFITGIDEIAISEISTFRPKNLTFERDYNNILGFSYDQVYLSLKSIND